MNIWNVDWLEQNSNRKYPFYDYASLQNEIFVIPNDFLVDLNFTTIYTDDLDITQFYLKNLIHSKNYIILDFYYKDESYARFTIVKSEHQKNKTYIVNNDGLYQTITIQHLDTINKQPQGKFTFTIEQTRILPGCIRVFMDCVRKVQIKKGDTIYAELTHTVGLEAGANIQLTKSGGYVEISAISDSELNLVDSCTEDLASTPPIRTINGIPPDENGNINIIGQEGIKVEEQSGGLTISDEFCTPCCGSEEIKVILEELKKFLTKKADLEQFLNDMQQKFLELQMLVAGSNKASNKCHD